MGGRVGFTSVVGELSEVEEVALGDSVEDVIREGTGRMTVRKNSVSKMRQGCQTTYTEQSQS